MWNTGSLIAPEYGYLGAEFKSYTCLQFSAMVICAPGWPVLQALCGSSIDLDVCGNSSALSS